MYCTCTLRVHVHYGAVRYDAMRCDAIGYGVSAVHGKQEICTLENKVDQFSELIKN